MTYDQNAAIHQLKDALSALKGEGLIVVFQGQNAYVANYRSLDGTGFWDCETTAQEKECIRSIENVKIEALGAFTTIHTF